MKYSKAKVYEMVVESQRETGQGLSGIVKLGNAPEIGGHLDDLVEEGVVLKNDTGGSMGHPESRNFYTPSEGYNVWEDDGVDEEHHSRFSGRYLHLVRYYLGILKEDDGENDFDITMKSIRQDPEWTNKYAAWLERNKEELEIMTGLSEIYVGEGIEFTEEEVEEIKSRGWYTDNKSIKICLEKSKEVEDNCNKRIEIFDNLIKITKGDDKHKKDFEKYSKEKEEVLEELKFRKRLHSWFGQLDDNTLVQDSLEEKKVTEEK